MAKQKYLMKSFGGYVSSFRELLEEALAWQKEHPDVTLVDGSFQIDECYYLRIFYREEDD